MLIMAISITSNICEVLVPAVRACPPLKALFSQEELLLMWPKHEESKLQGYHPPGEYH